MEVAKTKKVNVTAIQVSGQTALVEFVQEGHRKRVYIPAIEIVSDKVDLSILENGTPGCLPWKEIIIAGKLGITADQAQRLEDELYNSDVWVFEDVINKPNSVVAALQGMYKTDLVAIINTTRKYLSEKE